MLLSLLLLAASEAWACSFALPDAFSSTPDPNDTTPPSALALGSVDIYRGVGPERTLGGWSSTSCDDLGWISIALSASDDTTAEADLGLRVTLAGGTLPEGLGDPSGDLHLTLAGELPGGLTLVWIDEATDEQEPFDFDLELSALDAAGNASEPIVLNLQDPGSAGRCSHAPRGAGWAALGLVLAGLGRRRG